MAAAHVRWAKGGEAEVTALAGDRLRVRSTISSAPGSPLEGSLVASGKLVRLKVARCRREGDAFEIEGRLIDATRELRAEVAGLVASGAEGAG
ncbi:MAG: hypothetical protein IT372_04995 [Polyangiaceae bacterium]|nr:hypothetical protein [Polyangiaceae bacterium]